MSADLPSQLLAEQHRQIDQGVQGVVDGTGKLGALDKSLELLRLHLYVEEQLLFPPLAAAGLTMPVFVMKREHGQMWPLMMTLASACSTGAAIGTLQDPARQLLQLLNMHNPKEEQIVYTAADRFVAEHADEPLTPALQAAQIPDGWVCAMEPH